MTIDRNEVLMLERMVRDKAQRDKRIGIDPVIVGKMFELATRLSNLHAAMRTGRVLVLSVPPPITLTHTDVAALEGISGEPLVPIHEEGDVQ